MSPWRRLPPFTQELAVELYRRTVDRHRYHRTRVHDWNVWTQSSPITLASDRTWITGNWNDRPKLCPLLFDQTDTTSELLSQILHTRFTNCQGYARG